MVYLLKTLLLIANTFIILIFLQGLHIVSIDLPHQIFALFGFLFLIFVEAFVLFFIIGISRLVESALSELQKSKESVDLNDKEFTDYEKYTKQLLYQIKTSKSKTFPWTFLIIILGTCAILMGGALDVGLVSTYYHVGLVYGLLAALTVGSINQWKLLTKSNLILRKTKTLFQLPDQSM